MPIVDLANTPAFATPADLATYLQRDFSAADTATAELLLGLASAAVTAETGQRFTFTANDTVKIRPRNGRIRLPQRPVTAVASVLTSTGAAVTHQWDGIGDIDVDPYGSWSTWGTWSRRPLPLTVTYSHGYAVIPADVKGIVLEVAARGLTNPEGLNSETIGSYAYSNGIPATGVPVGVLLSPLQKAALAKYKVPASPISMLT